jgi:hypothetical protein
MNIQTATVLIAGISVVIGVINSIRSNSRADEQRQVELVSQIYSRLQDKDFLTEYNELIHQWDFTNYEDFTPKYSLTTGHYEEFNQHMRVARILNHVCEFIDKGIIDSKFISESIAWDIIRYWEKFGPIVKIGRQVTNNPLAFDDVEKVYPQLKQQFQERMTKLQQQQATIGT